MVAEAWGWFSNNVWVFIFILQIGCYAPGERLGWGMEDWIASLIVTLLLIIYSYVMANYVFPKYPVILGLPFFLVAFAPGLLLYNGVVLFTDFGKELANEMPLWVLALSATCRFVCESTVQLNKYYGVPGFTDWLKWPIQKVDEPYTLNYLGCCSVTRERGGNPDAFSAFFFGIPVAILTAIVNDDDAGWIIAINAIYQVEQLLALLGGPVFHLCGQMPGDHILALNGEAADARKVMSDGIMRGVVGVIFLWEAQLTLIYHCLFFRKIGGW